MTVVKAPLFEHPAPRGAGRLGRHIEHDERSRAFAVTPSAPGQRKRRKWRRYGFILDQNRYTIPGTQRVVALGSCTGNAATGAVNTTPLHRPKKVYDENFAVKVYSRATEIDPFPGTYPPTDTGSSGLSVCKVLVELGLISAYHHAFGIEQSLDALQDHAVLTGVNWYEGFDNPDANGLVNIAGQVRGGHEFLVREYIPHPVAPLEALIGCDNSWSDMWGLKGRFFMTVRTWAELLSQQGDVTVPIK